MPIRTRSLALVAPLLVLVGLTAGCGGSDDEAAGPATEATGTITIQDFAFGPVMATAARGDTIRVVNADGTEHTLTADDRSFDTGAFSDGSKTIRLDEAGSFSYHCDIHTYMKGTIEVAG